DPGHRRQAGHQGIGHALGDHHHRHDDAGADVARQHRTPVVLQPLKHRYCPKEKAASLTWPARIAVYCIASSTQLRPARLARASAAITRTASESPFSNSPSCATPRLTVTWSQPGMSAASMAARSFSAIFRASMALVCGAITWNS